MIVLQKKITLPSYPRGFHLITDEVIRQIPELNNLTAGILHVFIQHTSASLTINENADPTVRKDFEQHFNYMVPEDQPYYKHTYEGSDDMPAHIKASMLGSSISIPVTDGKINTGTWQGIYLCEHRDQASPRHLVITLMGK
jgi:secondary thiamine-phosphate synthase enzyme